MLSACPAKAKPTADPKPTPDPYLDNVSAPDIFLNNAISPFKPIIPSPHSGVILENLSRVPELEELKASILTDIKTIHNYSPKPSHKKAFSFQFHKQYKKGPVTKHFDYRQPSNKEYSITEEKTHKDYPTLFYGQFQ